MSSINKTLFDQDDDYQPIDNSLESDGQQQEIIMIRSTCSKSNQQQQNKQNQQPTQDYSGLQNSSNNTSSSSFYRNPFHSKNHPSSINRPHHHQQPNLNFKSTTTTENNNSSPFDQTFSHLSPRDSSKSGSSSFPISISIPIPGIDHFHSHSHPHSHHYYHDDDDDDDHHHHHHQPIPIQSQPLSPPPHSINFSFSTSIPLTQSDSKNPFSSFQPFQPSHLYYSNNNNSNNNNSSSSSSSPLHQQPQQQQQKQPQPQQDLLKLTHHLHHNTWPNLQISSSFSPSSSTLVTTTTTTTSHPPHSQQQNLDSSSTNNTCIINHHSQTLSVPQPSLTPRPRFIVNRKSPTSSIQQHLKTSSTTSTSSPLPPLTRDSSSVFPHLAATPPLPAPPANLIKKFLTGSNNRPPSSILSPSMAAAHHQSDVHLLSSSQPTTTRPFNSSLSLQDHHTSSLLLSPHHQSFVHNNNTLTCPTLPQSGIPPRSSLSLSLALSNSISSTTSPSSSYNSDIPFRFNHHNINNSSTHQLTRHADSLPPFFKNRSHRPRSSSPNGSVSSFFTTNSSFPIFDASPSTYPPPHDSDSVHSSHQLEHLSPRRPDSPITPTTRYFPQKFSSALSKLTTNNVQRVQKDEAVETLLLPNHSRPSTSTLPTAVHPNLSVEQVFDTEVWEDAIETDHTSSSSPNNRSVISRLDLATRSPSTSDLLEPTSQSLLTDSSIVIEKKRASLQSHEKRNSIHSQTRNSPRPSPRSLLSNRSRSKALLALSARNSVVSLLSVASNGGSALSISHSDGAGEYQDAADQAEWMDIDGGDAYEDLDKAEQLVREVSRQSAIDQTQALQDAAEAKRRYTALLDSHRSNDLLLATGSGSNRHSSQLGKDAIDSRLGHRFSNHSFTLTSSPRLLSRQGSRSGENFEETSSECHSSSTRQRDSTGSQGSRILLFTRKLKPLWGRNSPKFEDGSELDPIVELENGTDDTARNTTASPFSQESSSGFDHARSDPSGSLRWRPRPLFLKPAAGAASQSGFSARLSESPNFGQRQSNSSGYGTTEASSFDPQQPRHLSLGKLTPRSHSSASSKTFHSRDSSQSRDPFPSRPGSESLTGTSLHQSGQQPDSPKGHVLSDQTIAMTDDRDASRSLAGYPFIQADNRPRLRTLHNQPSLVFDVDQGPSAESFTSSSQLEQGGLPIFFKAAPEPSSTYGSETLPSSPDQTNPVDLPLVTHSTYSSQYLGASFERRVNENEKEDDSLFIDTASKKNIPDPTTVSHDAHSASSPLIYPSSFTLIKTNSPSYGATFLPATDAVDNTGTAPAAINPSVRALKDASPDSLRACSPGESRPIPPTRSQTFGRASHTLPAPLLPSLPVHDTTATTPGKVARDVGGLEKFKRNGGVKKAISDFPNSLNIMRHVSQTASIKSSFEPISHGAIAPGEIGLSVDAKHSSALSSWPSWAGKTNSPHIQHIDVDPSLSHGAKSLISARSLPSVYSQGNSSAMEDAFEITGRAFMPEAQKLSVLWDASTSHSSPSSQTSREEMSLESQLQNLARMSKASSPLLDVRREPGVDMMKPTLRSIKGRSRLVSGPIKLDPASESQALWQMIRGPPESNLGSTAVKKKTLKKK